MADYPNSITSLSTKLYDQIIDADHINNLQDEVTAIETELGLNARGVASTVSDRIEALELELGTNASGVVSTVAIRLTNIEADIASNASDIATNVIDIAARKVLQITYGTISRQTISSGYTTFPDDDTTPQVTEGAQIATLTVPTSTSSGNKLIFIANFCMMENNNLANGLAVALYDSTSSSAIQAIPLGNGANLATGHNGETIAFTVVATANGGAETYQIRGSASDGSSVGIQINYTPRGTGGFTRYNSTTTPFICIEVEA